jgi:threonyl-tRNA synthetase
MIGCGGGGGGGGAQDNKFKLEIIKEKVPDGAMCTAYRCGPLIDLCKGPHVADTARIKAMTVTKNSSCYWKGDAARDTLQRVYGISFPDKDKLAEYQALMAAAHERDHRRIGLVWHCTAPPLSVLCLCCNVS